MNKESKKVPPSPMLEQSIQLLTQALRGIAAAAGVEPAFVNVPQFFYDCMYGNWSPSDEALSCFTADEEQKNQQVRQLDECLRAALPEAKHSLLRRYAEALDSRASTEQDYAYLMGFQTGFRMFLLGLMDPEQIMNGYREAAAR